jgi:hypothetical protein
MPKPQRLSPKDAHSVLDRTFHGKSKVVSIVGEKAFALLESLRDRGITGGAAYDALIAESALRAGAERLLTLNRKHFDRLAPEGLVIAEP